MLRFFSSILLCLAFAGALLAAVPAAVAATPSTPVVKLINPIGGTSSTPRGETDVMKILGLTINYALGIIGSLTLVVFVYGGVLWLTSGGTPEKIKTGSQAMMWAVIGLVVIFASYAILSTIISGLGVRGAGSGLPAPATTPQSGAATPLPTP